MNPTLFKREFYKCRPFREALSPGDLSSRPLLCAGMVHPLAVSSLLCEYKVECSTDILWLYESEFWDQIVIVLPGFYSVDSPLI